MRDEGPSRGQDTYFTLIDVDASSPSSRLKEIIQEQKVEIDTLTVKLQRSQWFIDYLEQRNKKLEDQQTLIALRQIREDRALARKRPGDMTAFE